MNQPTRNIKELESALKLADKFTLWVIVKYLELDSYEFTKNIAKTLNKDNANDVIQYLSGALTRNNMLITMISKYVTKDKFTNKFTWEQKWIVWGKK